MEEIMTGEFKKSEKITFIQRSLHIRHFATNIDVVCQLIPFVDICGLQNINSSYRVLAQI